MGPRRKLLAAVEGARARYKQARVNMQEISCTMWTGPLLSMAGVESLVTNVELPRVAVVMYAGEPPDWGNNRRRRSQQNPAVRPLPEGTPTMMVDICRARCSSYSTGGSGGEDQLTLNVSFEILGSVQTTQRHPFEIRCLSDDHYRSLNPSLDPNFAPGTMVTFHPSVSRGERAVLFGPHITWSRDSHPVYPHAFRTCVFAFLCCAQLGPRELQALPKDVVLCIIARLAALYNVDPFADVAFPGRLKADDEDDDAN